MRRLGIELTDRCNLKCGHCLREINSAKLDIDGAVARAAITDAAKMGFEAVIFTGGEPTLHPDFSELVTHAVAAGLDVTVVTNGQRPETLFKLAGHSAVREKLTIALSLESPTERGFEAVRGNRSYRRFMRTVLGLTARKMKTRFSVTIGPWNRYEWTGILSLAHQLGIGSVSVATYQPTPHDLPAYGTIGELQTLQEEIEAAASMTPIDVTLSYEPVTDRATHQCGTLALTDMNVNYRGEMTFCCQLSSLNKSASPDAVVVADLNKIPLHQAVAKQAQSVAGFLDSKLQAWQNGPPRPEDRHPCAYCLRTFGQLAHPQSKDAA